jgi:hypothetical protein
VRDGADAVAVDPTRENTVELLRKGKRMTVTVPAM